MLEALGLFQPSCAVSFDKKIKIMDFHHLSHAFAFESVCARLTEFNFLDSNYSKQASNYSSATVLHSASRQFRNFGNSMNNLYTLYKFDVLIQVGEIKHFPLENILTS